MTTFDSTLGPQVLQSSIDFSGAGDNIAIVGSPKKIIKVLQFFFVLSAATNLIFKSAATALTGTMQYPSAGAQVQDFIQLPLTCLQAGDGFVINSSSAVQIGGTIWFIRA